MCTEHYGAVPFLRVSIVRRVKFFKLHYKLISRRTLLTMDLYKGIAFQPTPEQFYSLQMRNISWGYVPNVHSTAAPIDVEGTGYRLSDTLIVLWKLSSVIGGIIVGIIGLWFVYEIISFLLWMIVNLFAHGFSWKLLKAFCGETLAAVLAMLKKRLLVMKKYVDQRMEFIANNDENKSPPALANSGVENHTYESIYVEEK